MTVNPSEVVFGTVEDLKFVVSDAATAIAEWAESEVDEDDR